MSSFYIVRRQWSQTDQDSYVVKAESKQAIQDMYKAQGDRGPRYVEIEAVGDEIFELKGSSLSKMSV